MSALSRSILLTLDERQRASKLHRQTLRVNMCELSTIDNSRALVRWPVHNHLQTLGFVPSPNHPELCGSQAGVEQLALGLYVVRGDNM